VKTFVGTSANALKTQIWAALIAVLILKFLQLKSKFNWSLSHLVALLRQQLFVYRDLWLDDPFQAPPALTGVHDGQLQIGVLDSVLDWTAARARLRPYSQSKEDNALSIWIAAFSIRHNLTSNLLLPLCGLVNYVQSF
jgi:hypothetical protein